MIPDTITRDHVLEALRQIDTSPVPPHRQSVDYDLVHDGRRYPPKFVITIAAKHATGAELTPDKFLGGAETNSFLEKLGFRVVRRTKPTVVGPEADVQTVRMVFERLVPDAAERKLIATVFAETIEQAHAAGEARWEITLQRDLVRLNGGRVLVFDVRPKDVFVGLHPDLLEPSALARLEAVGEQAGRFAPLPDYLLYRFPHSALADLWGPLKAAYRRFVADAVLTGRQCAWARFHAPAVVDYLAELVGRDLPQPVYGNAEAENVESARGVFWVNQGTNYDVEGPGNYLFARKKDAAGATPAHWARVRDLVPGDVVVHHVAGLVLAVSRVRERALEWKRSEEPAAEGWRVNLESWPLATPIDVASVFGSEAARKEVHLDSAQGPFDRNGDVKQGYVWNFSEEGLAALRAGSADSEAWPAWIAASRARFWMFHAAPELYDVRGAVKALRELSWSVRQHKSEIHAGDIVFIWESGSHAGIVAQARVLTEPAVAPPDPAEAPYVRAGLRMDEDELVVRLAIERIVEPAIDGDDMRADPSLTSLAVFSSPQRTNSSMTPAQGALFLQWIEGVRPPRVVKIAPGGGGEFWNECLAGGYVCVGWDEVGDLRQFPDWTSFRKAFGAKCELGNTKGHVTSKAQELWTLARLKPGDKIVANRGISRVLGVGTVKEPGYVWNEERPYFKHTVTVDWDTSLACEIPAHKHWGMTTVGKVPPNVVALVLPELSGANAVVDAMTSNTLAARGAAGVRQVRSSAAPPALSPFASLVRALQSKESRLWFSDEVVAHYVLALQAKRFVILTGVSGTGKTQLALAVAKQFMPRTKRVKHADPPSGAVSKRVSPYMGKGRSMILPSVLAAGLELGGLEGTGSMKIDVEYPHGTAELSCYREVRSAASSVHHLSLKGPVAEWVKSLPIGSDIFFELLEQGDGGRDRLRMSVPVAHEEVTTVKNYEVVAVRPDWTDGRGLLGFYNPLTRRYVATPFLRLLFEANEEMRRATVEARPPAPFFVILDEMNLARVEQYFSDFLSAMESGEAIALHDDARLESGEVETDDDEEVEPVPRRVKVPSNLFFTGTVNVDETTYMFSPKVLDRAFVIEFNDVDLLGYGMRDLDEDEGSALELESWSGFGAFVAVTADDWDALAKVDKGEIRAALAQVHGILEQDNRHFGYRVANEIGRFITLAAKQCADPVEGLQVALDLAILSKLLPKLHGTQQELEKLLSDLLAFTLGEGRASEHESWAPTQGGLAAVSEAEDAREPWMPRSSLKIWRMLKRLRAQGFTSFIE